MARKTYMPTWRPNSPLVPCPERYRTAIITAWQIFGNVPPEAQAQVLNTPRPAEEWASFARVLAHALRKIKGMTPEVKDFMRRYPDLLNWIDS